MKRAVLTLSILMSVAGCAAAQIVTTNIPTVDLTGKTLGPEMPVEQILDALDQVGQGLKDFDARVSMGQADDVSGEDLTRSGRVCYRIGPDGNAAVNVDFDKKIVGKRMQDKRVQYLLNDGWLTDRDYDRKVEIRRQVTKPGQKINLLKLGEGPFPLPIGQKREDVLANFDVAKGGVGKDDPKDTVHLQLTPKKGTSFERKFKTIDVWVDVKTHFPVRIQTLDKNETTTRTTDLNNIRINPGLKDSDFELPRIGDDWQRTQEDYKD